MDIRRAIEGVPDQGHHYTLVESVADHIADTLFGGDERVTRVEGSHHQAGAEPGGRIDRHHFGAPSAHEGRFDHRRPEQARLGDRRAAGRCRLRSGASHACRRRSRWCAGGVHRAHRRALGAVSGRIERGGRGRGARGPRRRAFRPRPRSAGQQRIDAVRRRLGRGLARRLGRSFPRQRGRAADSLPAFRRRFAARRARRDHQYPRSADHQSAARSGGLHALQAGAGGGDPFARAGVRALGPGERDRAPA